MGWFSRKYSQPVRETATAPAGSTDLTGAAAGQVFDQLWDAAGSAGGSPQWVADSGGISGSIPPGARVVSTQTTINGQPASAEQIAAIESLVGMDLNADGVIGPAHGPGSCGG